MGLNFSKTFTEDIQISVGCQLHFLSSVIVVLLLKGFKLFLVLPQEKSGSFQAHDNLSKQLDLNNIPLVGFLCPNVSDEIMRPKYNNLIHISKYKLLAPT